MDEQINRVIGSSKQKSKRIKKEAAEAAASDVEQESSRKKRKKSERNTETVTKDITTCTASTIYDGNSNNNYDSDNSVDNNLNRPTIKGSKKRLNVHDTETSRGKVEIVIREMSTLPFHHVTSLDSDDCVIFAYWDACAMPSSSTIEYSIKSSGRKLLAKHPTNSKVTYVGTEYKHANLSYKLPDDSRSVRIFKMRPILPEKESSALLPEEMNKTERSEVIRSKFSSKKVARNLAQSKKHAVNLSQRDADRLEQLTFNTSVVEGGGGGEKK